LFSAKPHHISFFFLFNNECYIFRREKKEEAKIEKRRKKEVMKNARQKERSGENSLVRCSITISCVLAIRIRERLMNNYSI